MSKKIMLYCVLVLLLVMGAFASMAINGYGMLIMCYASLGLCVTFIVELLDVVRRQDLTPSEKRVAGIELAALSSICLLLALQGLSINVPFAAALIPILLAVLALIALYNLFVIRATLMDAPLKVRAGVFAYFGSLLLLIAASYMFGLTDRVAVVATLLALALIVVFFVLSGRRNLTIVGGENTNPWRIIWYAKNKSAVLLIGLGLMTSYFTLRTLDILPPLYFGSMPNGYSKLVREVRSSNDDTKKEQLKSFEDAYRNFQPDL